jgi:ABC-type transport system involved in multi-copper enzyme maturation permease subunit
MAVLSFAGFVMVLVALSIGNHSLNLEKFRKCEIFYRSQPVSVWQYALSKYIIVIAGPVIILLGIGIINLALVIPFIAQFFRFNIADAFAGLFVSLLIYSRSILVVGSIGFLISAIFKEKAFMKLVLILVSSQLIIVFSHFSLGTPMLDIFQYIMQLINPLGNIQNMIDLENMQSVMDFRSAMNARILLFNWHSALQIIASATFFVLAVIIYGRKEIN